MKTDTLQKKLTGKFIVIDGPDGCGKSTHVKLLADWLKGNNVKVQTFRDPGDTAVGEKIREILLNPQHKTMNTRTELLLYMAARAQLWQEKIAPALKSACCVILDRWLSSTCAYQGYAGGFGIESVIKLAENCLERVWPDLTIILDIDLDTASKKLKENLDRMEQKGQPYHEKVHKGFVKLAKERPDFVVVNAVQTIEIVKTKVIEAINGYF